ncbi:PilZ domain-containing protein [Altererythrobacter sp. TH136]|uniref:PilZ domain-containing protein n=1 Tax=Altererythrobacter sp. TH136 TaxID=2067415 RepID=UPI001162C529|nr:PilZ domain-containing protein [Altererythrobacter sp. TH136]QDM40106.1 PilZ domain-containing protein [Altererythrobacter sp. TH136]
MGEERRDDRHDIEVWGHYRTPNGLKRDVPVKDLSETGCRFFDKFSSLLPGAEITLRIESLGPFQATVRWQEAGYVGVEFQNRLYGPMFDHIRLRLSR